VPLRVQPCCCSSTCVCAALLLLIHLCVRSPAAAHPPVCTQPCCCSSTCVYAALLLLIHLCVRSPAAAHPPVCAALVLLIHLCVQPCYCSSTCVCSPAAAHPTVAQTLPWPVCSRSDYQALHQECLKDQTALAIPLDEAHELLLAPLPALQSKPPGVLWHRAWPAMCPVSRLGALWAPRQALSSLAAWA